MVVVFSKQRLPLFGVPPPILYRRSIRSFDLLRRFSNFQRGMHWFRRRFYMIGFRLLGAKGTEPAVVGIRPSSTMRKLDDELLSLQAHSLNRNAEHGGKVFLLHVEALL